MGVARSSSTAMARHRHILVHPRRHRSFTLSSLSKTIVVLMRFDAFQEQREACAPCVQLPVHGRALQLIACGIGGAAGKSEQLSYPGRILVPFAVLPLASQMSAKQVSSNFRTTRHSHAARLPVPAPGWHHCGHSLHHPGHPHPCTCQV